MTRAGRRGRPAVRPPTSSTSADRAAVEALPAAVVGEHGQVDGLINCAGIIQPFVPLLDLDYADIERVMAVNFWGPVHTTKAFLPHLVARPRAHLVNVSSMGAFLPVPGQTAYGRRRRPCGSSPKVCTPSWPDTSVSVTVVFPARPARGSRW